MGEKWEGFQRSQCSQSCGASGDSGECSVEFSGEYIMPVVIVEEVEKCMLSILVKVLVIVIVIMVTDCGGKYIMMVVMT